MPVGHPGGDEQGTMGGSPWAGESYRQRTE